MTRVCGHITAHSRPKHYLKILLRSLQKGKGKGKGALSLGSDSGLSIESTELKADLVARLTRLLETTVGVSSRKQITQCTNL